MLQTICRQESLFLVFCISIFFLCALIPSRSLGQVIIKERMELNPKNERNNTTTNFPEFDDISRPELNSESLFPISFDRLLVLRDGSLTIHFNDAIGNQTINPDQTPLTVKVIRNGQSQTITVEPASYLPKPLEISNNLTQCTELIYNTRPYTLKTEDDSLVVEDADIFKYFERFYNSGQWFEETDYSRSDLNFLSVSRTILNETDYYSESEQRSFIKYDLSYLQTNGRLDSAALFLTPTNFYPETDPSELDPFYIIPATSSWSEDTITWQTQPSVSSSSARLVDQNFLDGISYKIDVTEQVRPWLGGSEANGFGLFPTELPGVQEFEVTDIGIASSEHGHSNNSPRRPYLQLQLNNPNSLPSSQQLDTLSLKAGDVIQLAYPESETAFFTEYDSTGYDVLFSSYEGCSREELDITLGLQPTNATDSVWIQVELNPENIAPGDTSEIVPRLAFSNGTTQDFPPGQRFNAELAAGANYGSLLDIPTGDTADVISNTPAGFAFIASENIDADSVISVINVNTTLVPGGGIIIGEAPDMPVPTPVMGTTGRQTTTSPAARQQASSFSPQPIGIPLSGTGQVVIREPATCEQPEEILLGETKYFYAIPDNTNPNKLLVCELESEGLTPGEAPDEAVEDPFGDDPLEVVAGGDKSGVYWERKYPEIDSDGNLTTHDLSDKLIRLVGRYWEKDKTYKVKLKGSSGSKTGELEIEVAEPERLGDDYGKAKDALDNEFEMDSLIISNAGKYGVLPQLIKAQIFNEAKKKDFGGSIGTGFAPSWRYEPYTGQFGNRYFSYWSGEYFIKDSEDADFSDVPNHSHLKPKDYFRSLKTIWDIVKEESELVDTSKPDRFGARKSNGKMDFGVYNGIQDDYDEFFDKYKDDSKLSDMAKADSARSDFIKFFKDDWKDEGASNIIAQTRTATSYGYLQVLYTTACWLEDTPGCFVPEKINENSKFDINVRLQEKYMKDKFKSEWESNNWSNGYEANFREGILKAWNQNSEYPNKVFDDLKDYNPQKN